MTSLLQRKAAIIATAFLTAVSGISSAKIVPEPEEDKFSPTWSDTYTTITCTKDKQFTMTADWTAYQSITDWDRLNGETEDQNKAFQQAFDNAAGPIFAKIWSDLIGKGYTPDHVATQDPDFAKDISSAMEQTVQQIEAVTGVTIAIEGTIYEAVPGCSLK